MKDKLAAYGSRWLSGDWEKDDILVCCEVKLSRNLESHPFFRNASIDDRCRIKGIFSQAYDEIGNRETIDISTVDDVGRKIIIENRMSSASFPFDRPFSCIFYNKANGTSACVNDEDHVRIRTVGMDFGSALEKALDEEQSLVGCGMNFSYRKDFGFLTSHYEESGSGMRLSAILHLPAINLLSMAFPFSLRATTENLTISRAFGPSGGSGFFCNMVQIHVDPPSVAHIKKCVGHLESVIKFAVEKESEYREMIIKGDANAKMDDAYNSMGAAWGAMTNSMSLSFDDAGRAVSRSVLAVKCGLYKGDSRAGLIGSLRDSVTGMMSGHLAAKTGCTAGISEDRARATFLRAVVRKNGEYGLK